VSIDSFISNSAFLEQKNKYRGLVSRFRSKAFVRDRKRSPTLNFRSGLRALLLESRSLLDTSLFEPFQNWVMQQNRSQLPDLMRSSVGYEELDGYIEADELPLGTELIWLSERIRVNCETINQFRSRAQTIETLVFAGELEQAITELQSLEAQLGVSIWSIQLRLALEHQAGGLERQKRYTAEVKSVYTRGLLGFITSNTSVRNEDRTTISKYHGDMMARIDRHKFYDDALKSYMRFRLLGEMPVSDADMATLLRVEQSHHIIDVYETLVTIVQWICQKDDRSLSTSRHTLRCLQRMDVVRDFRLRKIQNSLLGHHFDPALPHRRRKVSDALFGAKVHVAVRESRKTEFRDRPVDPWDLIYAGFARAHGRSAKVAGIKPGAIPECLGAVLSRTQNFNDGYLRLVKLATNLRGLPVAAGLLEFLSLLQRQVPDPKCEPWRISLNSPACGIEDIPLAQWGRTESFDFGIGGSVTDSAWRRFHDPVTESSSGDFGSRILSVIGLTMRGRYVEGTEMLEAMSSVPHAFRAIHPLLLLQTYFCQGDRQKLISLIASEVARSDGYADAMPISGSIGGFSWSDFDAVSNPLAASIALHGLWVSNEKDETASLLRFAVGRALKKLRISLPSELVDSASEFNSRELIYFLRFVCTSNVLDVARILKSSAAVMNERQAVCASLRILDPDNSDIYADEVADISNQLALDEGQWLVDRTRLHVDNEAFSRWAGRELAESFDRYRDLTSIDEVPAQNFDDLINEIVQLSSVQNEPILTQDESDAVLYMLLQRAANEFLNNPTFGLDFYLSKRIRHQSFVGLIRGPLEAANLITTKKQEAGEYQRNDYWMDQFDRADESARLELESALKRFSAKFDETLASAKEVRFHVRSPEKPDGLVFLELPPQILAITRSIIRQDTNVTELSTTLLALFWAALEKSLSNVRRFITEDLKTKIVNSFEELRGIARRSLEPDRSFRDFDRALGECSTDVQRKLDEAASWFVRTDVQAQMRMFKLKQIVRIAIDSALRCQRAFDPRIEKEVLEPEQDVLASVLVFIHDVLFVALDNSRAHSGMKSPAVSILVNPRIEEGRLIIRVESETRGQNRAAREKKLSEIKRLIDTGQYEPRTRKEGESGFFKIAAVVKQSDKGRIDFGFDDSGKFYLEVVYSMVMRSMPALLAEAA